MATTVGKIIGKERYKRSALNLGTVSSQMVSVMGDYGITSKLNLLFGAPYVKTKASAGTMRGTEGIQDLSLWLKWLALEKQTGKKTCMLFMV
jgi:hypothetical protein